MERVWDYVHKDPDAPHFGPWQTKEQEIKKKPSDLGTKKGNWAWIVDAESPEEFMERALEHDPYTAANNYGRLQEFINYKFKPAATTYQTEYGPAEFPGVTPEMEAWVRNELHKRGHRPKALILWGPSRTGKTQWARSLGHHSYMGTMFNIDCLDEGSDYIVFDDCDPDHLHSHYKCWIGAQDQFSATDKYRAKRLVKWGKPCIWLSNSDPRDSYQWDRDWVDSNALVINLTHKLYEPVPVNYMHPENGLFVGI